MIAHCGFNFEFVVLIFPNDQRWWTSFHVLFDIHISLTEGVPVSIFKNIGWDVFL